jgi:hypothetical protein
MVGERVREEATERGERALNRQKVITEAEEQDAAAEESLKVIFCNI